MSRSASIGRWWRQLPQRDQPQAISAELTVPNGKLHQIAAAPPQLRRRRQESGDDMNDETQDRNIRIEAMRYHPDTDTAPIY